MAYRNKTYVCFDADVDMGYYNTLRMWKANKHIDFDLFNAHDINEIRQGSNEDTIKGKLRERLLNTKLLIVLIGEKTKNLYKYVRWEIEQAQGLDIPIIAVNLNNKNGIDLERCPAILRDKPAVHIPFKKDCLVHAMNNWPGYYSTAKKEGGTSYLYKDFDKLI